MITKRCSIMTLNRFSVEQMFTITFIIEILVLRLSRVVFNPHFVCVKCNTSKVQLNSFVSLNKQLRP